MFIIIQQICLCYHLVYIISTENNYYIMTFFNQIYFCIQRLWITRMTSRCVWYSLALISILLLLRTKNVDGIQLWGMQIGRAPLLEKFTWKTLDFAYPNQRSRELAVASGEYVPENSLPVGIEIWGNKLFVTVPRWRDGECQKNISR